VQRLSCIITLKERVLVACSVVLNVLRYCKATASLVIIVLMSYIV